MQELLSKVSIKNELNEVSHLLEVPHVAALIPMEDESGFLEVARENLQHFISIVILILERDKLNVIGEDIHIVLQFYAFDG